MARSSDRCAYCNTPSTVLAPSKKFAHSNLFGGLGFVVAAKDDAHARSLHELGDVIVGGQPPEEKGN